MYGLDLLEFFRGEHSWRKLRVLLDQMPSSARLWRAQALDEDNAEHLAALAATNRHRAKHPSLEDHTPQVEKLTQLIEAVEALTTIVRVKGTEAAASARPPRPHPRPETALSRYLEAQAHADAIARDNEMLAGQQRWIEHQRKKAAAQG